ncbi:MAG: hypothetical protein J5883_05795, partial [Clostridiales bacterium]|nr:hypothetical protein [Clostridiales bacterium]
AETIEEDDGSEDELLERYVTINVSDDIFNPEEVTYVEYVDASEVLPSSNVFQSFEDAGPYLREKFNSRADVIYFSVKAPEGQEYISYYDDIQPVLYEFTGNYDEGDYYRYMDDIDSFEYILSDGYFEITIDYAYLTTLAQEQALSDEIDVVLDSLGLDGKTEIQKIYAIHKYMTDNITYDNDTLYDESYLLKYTAYAALINKTAVCNGYALLFYRMAGEAGINVRYMAGGDHAWNFVVLDGKAYYLDSTWDAGKDPNRYTYFLTGRNSFEKDHSIYNEYLCLFNEYDFSDKNYDAPMGINYFVDNMGPVKILSYYDDGHIKIMWRNNSGSNIAGYNIYVTGTDCNFNRSIISSYNSIEVDDLTPGVPYLVGVTPYALGYDSQYNVYGKTQFLKVTIGEGFQMESDGKIWYRDSAGNECKGWKKIDGKWYYFDTDNGGMKNGLIEINGKTYYLDDFSGYMRTGWVGYPTEWGITNWRYFGSDGAMKLGWFKVKDKWYYAEDNGSDVYKGFICGYGFHYIDGNYYFFNVDGSMYTGWYCKDGYWFYFGSDGVETHGWKQISGKWYYFSYDGLMQTGWQKIKNKWYYFETSGAMVTGWKKIGKKWYYFQDSGAMKTGWLKDNGKWYYLDSTGSMLVNVTSRINGKNYHFDTSGVCTNP